MVFVTTTQQSHCPVKAAIDNKWMNGHNYDTVKLYLQKSEL